MIGTTVTYHTYSKSFKATIVALNKTTFKIRLIETGETVRLTYSNELYGTHGRRSKSMERQYGPRYAVGIDFDNAQKVRAFHLNSIQSR